MSCVGGVTGPSIPFDDGATAEGVLPSAAELAGRETLTWEEFGEASRDLSRLVVESGWAPDLLVAIARGGLLLAGALSYAMGVKAVGTMNVEFYTGVGQTLEEPRLLPPLLDVSAITGHRVLVIDDVADSGRTLAMVMRLIGEHGLSLDGHASVPVQARSVVIYRKPRSVLVPDYEWRVTDRWINFPWSTKPVVRAGE